MTEIPTQPRKEITNNELSEKIDGLSQEIKSLKGYIVGDINNGDKIGMAERVRIIEKWIETRAWIEKLIIGGLIIEILGLIVIGARLIVTHPLP